MFDITERKQVEESLRESEEKFRNLFNNAEIGIFRTRLDGSEILDMNDKFIETFGYTREEMKGKPSVIHWVDPREREEMINRLSADGHVSNLECRMFNKQGNILTCITSLKLYQNLGILEGSIIDITDRVKAGEKLRENEEKYRTLFERESDAIFIYDPDTTNILDANEATSKIYGYDKDELIGMSYLKLSAEVQESTSATDRISEDDEVTIPNRLHRKKDGTIFPVDINDDTITLEGKIVKFAVSKDITEQKKAEDEKAKLEDQYRQSQKVESIGRLAGGMAHDLNNLLVPIIGYAELLGDDFDPDDERKESAYEIVQAGFRARDLVQQLLAFSRKQILEYKTLNINKIIEGFEKLLRHTIREDIDLEIIPSHDIQPIRADTGQIEQVIMNLCVNAQDAMPEGGKLTIETAMVELDKSYAANHSGSVQGEYVMLAISDTGCGMDEETRKLIFEPFFSTKGVMGTGLGLATVYGIVKQHGGNIWVYSESGQGTTFKVYLPLTEKGHIEKSVREESGRDLNGSETIMLAEDDEQVRHLARAVLRKRGYTVLVAKNGAEAWKVLGEHRNPVHLLLTDVVMPGINGSDLYTKAAEKYPELKVLYMSGYTDNIVALHGILDAGAHFVQKPFSSLVLAAKVREALESA